MFDASFKLSPLAKNGFGLYTFICGQNVFVNLPTGSGKSLIFPCVAKSRNAPMLQCQKLKADKGRFKLIQSVLL